MVHRFISLFFTLFTNISLLVIIIFGDKQNFMGSLLGGEHSTEENKTSFAFDCTILVDYGNTTVRNVGITVIIVFRMQKLFGKLKESIDRTETYLSTMTDQREYQHYCSKYRILSFAGIAYIFTAVRGVVIKNH